MSASNKESKSVNSHAEWEERIELSGLTEEQLQAVEQGGGVAEILLSRSQVDANSAVLSDEQLLRAAEQGGQLYVLVNVSIG